MTTPAYITGMGLVSPLGAGVDTTYRRMLDGVCGRRPIDRFDLTDYAQKTGGQLSAATEAQLLARYEDDALSFSMIWQALDEAGVLPAEPPAAADSRCGLILATNFGAMDLLEWCWRERLDTGQLDADTFRRHSHIVQRLAERLGVGGPRAQLSLSCASGAAAVAVAREWIRTGQATRVIAVAYDVLTEFCWYGLANLRTITDDCVRPFDRRRRGTVFSEGAAVLVLDRRPPTDTSHTCVILGAATNNNAFHLTAPEKQADGSRRVMAAALADSGLTARDIDFVAAHATGTQANDITESQAINNLFGSSGETVPVAAFKSALGHMLGAAGMAEIAIAARALRDGCLPPALNADEHDEACRVNCVRDTPMTAPFRAALTNSAGIGGSNAATVLAMARDVAPAPPATPRPLRVRIKRAGWVLPDGVGAGAAPPTVNAAAFTGADGALTEFSVKPYLHSVKGYLDRSAAYALAAVALCLEPQENHRRDMTTGLVSATQYGAPGSAFHFYRQSVTRGPRRASPMVFPHGYASTPANLAAIEFGIAGPHMVFSNAWSHVEAVRYAACLLAARRADNMICILVEAATATAVPDGVAVTNGAVALWLTRDDGDTALDVDTLADIPTNTRGTVYAVLADPAIVPSDAEI